MKFKLKYLIFIMIAALIVDMLGYIIPYFSFIAFCFVLTSLTFVMYLTFKSKMYFVSLIFLLVCIGGILNFMPMAFNNYKMPVLYNSSIEGLELKYSFHNNLSDLNFGYLGDRFNCGIGICSIGDFFVFAALILAIYLTIINVYRLNKKIIERRRKEMWERKKAELKK